MYFNIKFRLLLVTYLICLLAVISECKRGGGGRRGGTYRGSSSVWSKTKQNQANFDLNNSNRRGSKSQPDPSKPVLKPEPPIASAPPASKTQDVQKSSSTFINQEKSQVQQKPIGFEQANKNVPPQNTQQRPVGWDVKQDNSHTQIFNKNPAANVGQGHPSSVGNPTHISGQQGAPPPYSNIQHSYPSQVGHQPNYPAQQGTNYYGSGQHYSYGNTPNQPYQPQQQFGGYQSNPGMGGMPQQVPNTGLYHNNMNNMGYSPMMGNSNPYGGGYGGGGYAPGGYGGGGYGGGNGKSGGMFGSLFGGNKHGGYGGYGGYGGQGIGGYGKKFGGGFGMGFGGNAYRNAFFGLLVWNLVSSFTRKPYYVYNYHNNPEKIPQEISLPANAIVLCPDNVTSLCATNTAPLCTSNNTILCVALAQQTVPCEENSSLKCVNSTVTCNEDSDENCKESAGKPVTAAVNIPCVTNATVVGKSSGSVLPFTGTGDTTNLCVTTLAVPQPDEDVKAAEAAGCGPNSDQSKNSTCTATITPPAPISANNVTVANLNVTNPLAM